MGSYGMDDRHTSIPLPMLITVVTASLSKGIGNGLTYRADGPIDLGCLVMVPLRGKITEGIVIDSNVPLNDASFDIQKVHSILSLEPLLTPAQMTVLLQMQKQYFCPIRQLLSLFLPPPPWRLMMPKRERMFRLSNGKKILNGKNQKNVVEALQSAQWVSEPRLREETGVSTATLTSLVKTGVLEEGYQEEREHLEGDACTDIPQMPVSENLRIVYERLSQSGSTVSLLFHGAHDDRYSLYARLTEDNLTKEKSTIVLSPDIVSASLVHEALQRNIGKNRCLLLHSRTKDSERRGMYRKARSEPLVICGTRTALFLPAKNVGTVIIDEEHALSYKSEKSPRYHARWVAERLCAENGANLILASRTPSLESWRAATSDDRTYALIAHAQESQSQHSRAGVSVIDLAGVNFGKAYPFSPQLFQAIQDRLNMRETSVLLLNRRGGATALLCLECRHTINSASTQIPMTVHTVKGIPTLIDHYTGLMMPVPAHCPRCHSVRLLQTGAGTERAEMILKQQFPSARIVRADADTLENPKSMEQVLVAIQNGSTDILVGTAPVMRALSLSRVTLAAVLIADIGLSLPDFRAGERVCQALCQFVSLAKHAPAMRDIIIQTFRPNAPEIVAAQTGKFGSYLTQELLLREQAGYPPASKLIALIIRGEHAGKRAKFIEELLKKNARDTRVTSAPSVFSSSVWHVFLRGKQPEVVLSTLKNLSEIVIDIDPLNVM